MEICIELKQGYVTHANEVFFIEKEREKKEEPRMLARGF